MLNLIGEGIEQGAKKALSTATKEAGENMLKKALKKASEESGEGILSKLGKKIPVSYTDNIAQDIAVKAPEMQKLYRGIKAETPEKLEKYISDMLDPTIKPRTYEGAAYGEGYYFTPFRDSAESYAGNDLAKPYQAVLEIEQPRNRFIGINKQNQNRPVDFAIRAEKRIGGGRAASVGERDFDNYLKKNGILGDRVNDNITVIKDNDAVKNMRVIGRREPGGVWDYNDALNSANVQKDLDNASKFLGQPMYHSTDATFDKFDDAFLGSNTGYDNTAFGHFITPDKEFSQKFGDNTMQIDANIKKYITHPYNADYKYSGDELDKIVSDYLTATDNAEGLQALLDMAAEDGSSLYNAYRQDTLVNNPFDLAADEKKLLQDKGYDAVEFVEGVRNDLLDNANGDMSPVSSYAVFNGDNLKRAQDEFGKSVIVDKKGKPLDLYHGTDASFDKFGDIKTEPGYWFTEDKDYAQSHGKNLMTVNLDMRNPIDMNTADGENLLYDLARERFGIKGVVPEDKIFSKDFREFLQDKGYDGLIWDKDGKNTYVAFKPEQIKIRDK